MGLHGRFRYASRHRRLRYLDPRRNRHGSPDLRLPPCTRTSGDVARVSLLHGRFPHRLLPCSVPRRLALGHGASCAGFRHRHMDVHDGGPGFPGHGAHRHAPSKHHPTQQLQPSSQCSRLVHGLGQSVSAGFRTVGPVVGGWWYGASLETGIVGASWWAVAGVAALGCASSFLIYEGSGHEIILEGEEDEKLLG